MVDKLADSFNKTLKDFFGFEEQPNILIGVGVILIFLSAFFFVPGGVARGFGIVWFLSPLWLPVLLFFLAKHLWVVSRRALFIAKQEMVMLELLMPRDITKSPLAMEAVFAGIHQGGGEGNWYAKYVTGGVRPWWSLEILSDEGQLRFFVWTRKSMAPIVKTQFYAQYPNIQIIDAEDYALATPYDPKSMKVWGCEFALTKADPYPIKTYVDYGLERSPKEEEKIDPFGNLLEFLGSLKKTERIWVQILFRQTGNEKYKHDQKLLELAKGNVKNVSWKTLAQKEIKEIMEKAQVDIDEGEGRKSKIMRLTEGQKELIASIERNTAKQGFDVGIRVLYIATPDTFNSYNINGVTAMWKQFSSEVLNGFKPVGGLTTFKGYPWEDVGEVRRNKKRKELVESYKLRSFFHYPFQGEYFVLSTEEMATIFHPPSRTIAVSTLPRISSATAEAPSNLPT